MRGDGYKIVLRSDGRYHGRVSVGKDLPPKNFYSKKKSKGGTAQHVRDQIAAWEDERAKAPTPAEVPDGALTTVQEMTNYWLNNLVDKDENIKPKTRESYRYTAETRILPNLGAMSLRDIDIVAMHDFVARLRGIRWTVMKRVRDPETRIVTLKEIEKKWSDSAVKYACVVFKVIMSAAAGKVQRKTGLVADPIRGFKLPKGAEIAIDKDQVWNKDEIRTFVEFVERCDEAYGPLFKVLLGTGFRSGEALALREDDVDWEKATVRVDETLTELKGGRFTLGPPKSKPSRRTIPVDSVVLSALRQAIAFKLSRGITSPFIFVTGEGTHPSKSNLKRTFDRLTKLARVKKIRVHDLRHTHASLLLRETKDVQMVSERLGHRDAVITMQIYAHSLPEFHRDAVSNTSSFLWGISPQKTEKTDE